MIGKGLYQQLEKEQDIEVVSLLRLRLIYRRPLLILKLFLEQLKVTKRLKHNKPDLWLSYHCYYKAPDLLGHYCSKKLKIPYIIFQGIYSTKRRKKISSWLGFQLNKRALLSADLLITNKKRDFKNLSRLRDDIVFIAPGIEIKKFQFCELSRKDIRAKLKISDSTKLVVCVAMFRDDVKSKGVKIVINSIRDLLQKDHDIQLLLIGDGVCRHELEKYSSDIEKKVHFLGRLKQAELYKYFSAADVFAFPGINEALGMVYLEAQSCGLPVVAYSNWGASEAVIDKKTGLLSPYKQPEEFTANIEILVSNDNLRKKIGSAAKEHIRQHHDLSKNYGKLNILLKETVERYKKH
ncbi:MAG: glycosyltransferase family 4 protein [Desulfotalea sp.]